MLRDITLGQYYQTESKLHELDPRTKLVGTFVYLISLFVFTNAYVYIFAASFLLLCVLISHIPPTYMIKGMKPIIFLLVFTMVLNMLVTPGEVILSLWKLTITKEGVKQALYMGARLTLLVMGSNMMTLTTTPTRLTNGLERLMAPLKLIKVPVHEIAMMMSIALRFIPILMDETDRIMKAQLARGADFESGNLIKKAKSLVPVLVPLFISAFRRANDLAMAMEARCYHGGKGRTQMKPLKYRPRDFVAYLILILYLAGIILIGKYL